MNALFVNNLCYLEENVAVEVMSEEEKESLMRETLSYDPMGVRVGAMLATHLIHAAIAHAQLDLLFTYF